MLFRSCAAVRKELKPPIFGFFNPAPGAPLQGVLVGDTLELRCSNRFLAETIDKPDVMEVVSRKAGAILGHPVRTITVDLTKKPEKSPRMEQLMNFGRSHGDIIKIKNQ